MIRWERQQDGNWLGLSGELLVATVAKDAFEKEQWLWTITALRRPKGWRKGAGHRSSWIDARRAPTNIGSQKDAVRRSWEPSRPVPPRGCAREERVGRLEYDRSSQERLRLHVLLAIEL